MCILIPRNSQIDMFIKEIVVKKTLKFERNDYIFFGTTNAPNMF